MKDKENIETLQQNDEILSQIFLWKSNNKKPTWSDISHTSPEIKFYWSVSRLQGISCFPE
jgi:hypothetical protein